MSPDFGEVIAMAGASWAAIESKTRGIRRQSFIGRTYKFNMKRNGGQQKHVIASLKRQDGKQSQNCAGRLLAMGTLRSRRNERSWQ
jgi:hypothetical protein